MRLPRDLSGRDLAALLRCHYGYDIARQTGGPLRVGTLAAILGEVASHHGITRSELESAFSADIPPDRHIPY